ncbi:hypothetical protein CYMTET_31075 [Cymbomonas tetramitiformis]|uniref:Peptidase M28 domain-containing protein n=1 Tax=Cymbomonas tetramitiformis TaxID=36881 RepID=A0AAE0FI41_9CHLO|nr:hypothetical protein CYMTET_31075 [Cymbomonas tetramitiformis]
MRNRSKQSKEVDHTVSTPSLHRGVEKELDLDQSSGLCLRILALLFFYAAFLGTVQYLHFWLPEPVESTDPNHPEKFVAGNAIRHMEALCALGVRNVGSRANEVHAPEYILAELETLKIEASRVGAELEIDRQYASGAFYLGFLTDFTSVYHNLTNIVARLHWPGVSHRHAILLGAHYDSAWNSTGAVDDAIQVGTLLEFARGLLAGPPLRTSVVFNLNGGEETVLQAAHGFITQHRWAKDCRMVINLEAAGAGGRELLFQTGPGNLWLASAFLRAAPYPHTSVIAQELFHAEIIPGETDYRIYRDFGHIPGFDVAFIMDGWAYHTELDAPIRFTPGSAQRLGENYLATIREVSEAPEMLMDPSEQSYTAGGVWTVESGSRGTVFYDVLGVAVFAYSL